MAVKIAVPGRSCGAAPVWDITGGTVLWVETSGEAVHRFDPATGHDETLRLPQPVAAAHPRRRGGLVLTLRDGVALLDPDGSRRWLVYWGREGVLGAAAAVDQAGQLWVATAGDGTLLRVQADGAVLVVLQGVDLAGIAFSPDAGTMYLADVAGEYIAAADFDPDSGHLGPRRPLFPAPGGPGALHVDAGGGLWVTPNAGGAVLRYQPDGALDRQLVIDPAQPTGCAFGGIRLTDLYVTAAPPESAEPAGPLLVLAEAGEGSPTPVFAG
ncbi:MAG: SMP-30/gluconolactonase/LRE family protein [Pseudonocardiaceae bacterium]